MYILLSEKEKHKSDVYEENWLLPTDSSWVVSYEELFLCLWAFSSTERAPKYSRAKGRPHNLGRNNLLETDSNTLSCDDELIDWLRDVMALNGFGFWNRNKALRGESVDFKEETDSLLAKNWFLQRKILLKESNTCQFFYASWELKNQGSEKRLYN